MRITTIRTNTKHLLFCLCFFIPFSIFCQTEGTVIVVTNEAAEIFLDGDNLGKVAANEAKKVAATEGEHFIQAKKSNGVVIDETIVFESGKQKVVKLKFDIEEEKVEDTGPAPLYVVDAKLYLTGQLDQLVTEESSFEIQYYAFDAGDEALINMKILDGKGDANIEIRSYSSGGIIFTEKNFRDMVEKKVRFPEKGIYKFYLWTNHVLDRTAHFKMQRIPASTSSPTFSTAVKMRRDTIYHDILNTNIKVYGTNNQSYANKTSVKINLPKETLYWVYWIGVGQESRQEMETLSSKLSNGKVKNPIAAYGLRAIPSLPQHSSSATVNYRFMDNINTQAFKTSKEYKYFTFKQGNNITTDYALAKVISEEMNIGFSNMSNTTHDVTLRVGAFSIQKRYYMKN